MTRSPVTGEFIEACYLCQAHETSGSFDRGRFADYLRELGWRPKQVCGVAVWMCPECQREGGG